MRRLLVALVLGAGLVLSGPAAPQEPVPFDGKGTLVFSCSGCPQLLTGPSLYRVDASGTGFRRIETPRLSPYGPRWSPNGQRISLSSRFTDIWTVDPEGRSARRLTHACIECDYPPAAWSPTGRRLVFSRRGRLFTMNADGSRERRLFGRWRRSFSDPDWSPDGKRIAFDERGAFPYVIGADGLGFRRLRRVEGRHPRWSPNGRWIAFVGIARGGRALMIVRSDGTHPRVLFKQDTVDSSCSPAWSPDGRNVVFAVRRKFEDYDGHDLMVATLDGAPPRPIAIPELPPSAYSELYGLDWT
jgi:Tol biopolymer transport system component